MNCPQCKDTMLSMTERQGVEIDYCPKCRGVWLDRGELDKIIEKSQKAETVQQQQTQVAAPTPIPESFRADQYHGHYKQKRRKSFLEDLFD